MVRPRMHRVDYENEHELGRVNTENQESPVIIVLFMTNRPQEMHQYYNTF